MQGNDISDLPEEAQKIYKNVHASVKILYWVFQKALEEGFSEKQALEVCALYLRVLSS